MAAMKIRPVQVTVSRPGPVEHDDFCSCEQCMYAEVDDIVDHLPRETRAAYYAKKEREKALRESQLNSSNETNDTITTSFYQKPQNKEIKQVPSPPDEKLPPSSLSIRAMIRKLEDESVVLDEKVEDIHQEHVTNNDEKGECEEALHPDDASDDHVPSPPCEIDHDEMNRLYQEKRHLEEEIESLQAQYLEIHGQKMERRSNIDEGQDLIDELKSQVEDETSANEKRKKLLTLLPDRETNLEKMSQIVLKNKDKLAGMRQRWAKVESELESDYISLCRTIEQKQKDEHEQLAARDSLLKQITDYEDHIRHKEVMLVKYTKELDKQPTHGLARSNYTQQIMDALNTVAKQRKDTSRVIVDIKSTQNDINLLEGKLYRTYVEADAKVFNMAKVDDGQLRRTYRHLAETYKIIEEIIETIRQTGQVKRSRRTVEDQTATERAKNVESISKQLIADLKQIRAENNLLS